MKEINFMVGEEIKKSDRRGWEGEGDRKGPTKGKRGAMAKESHAGVRICLLRSSATAVGSGPVRLSWLPQLSPHSYRASPSPPSIYWELARSRIRRS